MKPILQGCGGVACLRQGFVRWGECQTSMVSLNLISDRTLSPLYSRIAFVDEF
jgi:hypothetical protein